MNQLIFGDNLSVLKTIPNDSVDLIYIDPPFFSDRDMYQQIKMPHLTTDGREVLITISAGCMSELKNYIAF